MDNRRFDTLTDAQRECLRLYAAPMRAKEIASELGVTVRAVEGLLARATEKVGAGSTVQAARELAAFELSNGYKIPVHFPSVDRPAESIETAASALPSEAALPPGRNIRFGPLERTGIILALTVAMILSIMAIVAVSEGVTRLAHAYYSDTS